MTEKLLFAAFGLVIFWIGVLVIACTYHEVENWITKRKIRKLRAKLTNK